MSDNWIITIIIVVVVVVFLGVGNYFVKKQKNKPPDDIYPMW